VTNISERTVSSGLFATTQVIGHLLFISAETLLDAARNQLNADVINQRISSWAAQTVAVTQMDVRVEGKENFPADSRVMVMSNHQSNFDIPVLYYALTPRIRMVAKKELFRVPLFGPAMKAGGFIEIDRQNRERAIQSLEQARQIMESGVPVWMAPEGTRSLDGNLLPFKKGGFYLASEMGADIVPVGLSGTRDALPPFQLKTSFRQRIGVVVGKAIQSAGKSREQLMDETHHAIEQLVVRANELRRG
jgi:1-acyl-sn-glycerol-3-phosphate acyltransferase